MVVGVFYNPQIALEGIQQILPDIVITDINMKEFSGIKLIKKIKKNNPNIKCIVLTVQQDTLTLMDSFRNGASGFIHKNCGMSELETCLNTVNENLFYSQENINFDIIFEDSPEKNLTLTQREIEIIKLLVTGMTSAEIGIKLFISEHTVKTHRKNILKKLKLAGTAELINYAHKNNLTA